MSVRLMVTIVIGLALLFMSMAVQAFEHHGSAGAEASPVFDERMSACFSRAMVGMDSVINARLGVPPEHALDLSVLESASDKRGMRFDEPLLAMILAAYLWVGSPHNYAIKVFYDCAASAPMMAERSAFLP